VRAARLQELRGELTAEAAAEEKRRPGTASSRGSRSRPGTASTVSDRSSPPAPLTSLVEDVAEAGEGLTVKRLSNHPAIGHRRQGLGRIAWSESYRWVVSCGCDRSVVIWSLASDKPLRRLDGHTGVVTDVAVIESRGLIASVAMDATMRCASTVCTVVVAARRLIHRAR
jgi:WD40 repeat protein